MTDQTPTHTHEVGDNLIVQLWATFECTVIDLTVTNGWPTYTVTIPDRGRFTDIYERNLFTAEQE